MVEIKFERFGELDVDGKIYYSDMIVWWDGEIEFVEKDHVFGMEDAVMIGKMMHDLLSLLETGRSFWVAAHTTSDESNSEQCED